MGSLNKFPSHSAHSYRFYLIDSPGHVAKAHATEATSDDEARDLAQLILKKQSKHRVVEVWEKARRVSPTR
jgi:hypothetical protein